MNWRKLLGILGWSVLVLLLLISALAVWVVLPIQPPVNDLAQLGYTFSIRAAKGLGLDWKAAYLTSLRDLKPSLIRLGADWDMVEPKDGNYDWSALDDEINALHGTKTKLILAIGHKTPRWPECHLPDWVKALPGDQVEAKLDDMLRAVVARYQNDPALQTWQVENEALFPFGECPSWSGDRSLLKREITLVKQLDPNHEIYTTDSGELSLWWRTSSLPIDGLGVSLYRVVYSGRYIYWPVNPYFYWLRAKAVSWLVPKIIISELEMEPWGPKSVEQLDTAEGYKSFSPWDMQGRIDYARHTGASTILAWGVEWWYYMDVVRHEPDYWQAAQKVFASQP